MKPSYALHKAHCLAWLKQQADNSFDSIVTDPPYELGFMGKAWDKTGIAYSVEVWREALRVLKPGGHLLAFSATRTYHRMVCAIEDAGFEIRDQLAWVYGEGFPKSNDFACDYRASRARGKRLLRPGFEGHPLSEGWGTALKPAWEPIAMARKAMTGTTGENVLAHGVGGLNIDGCRVPTGDKLGGGAENLKTREHSDAWDRPWKRDADATAAHSAKVRANVERAEALGRWPANLIHDGSEEVVALFPQSDARDGSGKGDGMGFQGGGAVSRAFLPRGDTGSAARFFYCAKPSRRDRNEGLASSDQPAVSTNATMHDRQTADWAARNGNFHPTVKPTALMRWLCRLVTPPGGTVLDFFTGSGSTGKGSVLEGFNFVGVDRDEDGDGKPLGYLEIAHARIRWALEHGDGEADQPAPGTKAVKPPKAKAAKVAKPKKAANDESPAAGQGDLFGAAA